MGLDIAFNRIADAYNAQRAHPHEVSAQIGPAIAAVAGPGALVLELGVGTGRIALPVCAAGCRVVGVDLARKMLRVAQQRPNARIELVQADVAQLPMRADRFDAVLAVHVLRLIAGTGARRWPRSRACCAQAGRSSAAIGATRKAAPSVCAASCARP